MSMVVAIFLLIGALVAGAVFWARMPADGVGRRPRERRQASGLQGQVTEWLYWDAAVEKPDVKRFTESSPPPPTTPADRALHAAVLRTSLRHRVSPDEAYRRLKVRTKSSLGSAFLDGAMRRAIRIHWRRRYRGPQDLFLPWFYLIASIRYGRRHMFLETLNAALKELDYA